MNNSAFQRSLADILQTAREVSADLGNEVEAVLREGRDRPLTTVEAQQLVARVIAVVERRGPAIVGDAGTSSLRRNLSQLRDDVASARNGQVNRDRVVLEARDGLGGPVSPTPVFHGRKIPMNEGLIKTIDIPLWNKNERLEIHLEQFRQTNGRGPDNEELLELMLSRMQLPGSLDDEFQILKLANSIAVSGVRVAPILARDGTLLDGNRRVAACYLILTSDEFTPEQKARVEYMYVWQLTEHATPDDEEAVVVSLNFEPDGKLPWPDYVKARKIYDEWQHMLALEPRTPGPRRIRELKVLLAKKFAYGTETDAVNRYLKMVDWAKDFEDFHVNTRERDTFEVRHRAGEYFQYFDELSKGEKAGGVAHALGQDDSLKRLVFDLLFQKKFKNWRVVRLLKHLPDSPELVAKLSEIRDRPTPSDDDLERAQDDVEEVLALCQGKRAETRQLGANAKVESFVRFLEQLPVGAFRDVITDDNLVRLLHALELVKPEAQAILDQRAAAQQ